MGAPNTEPRVLLLEDELDACARALLHEPFSMQVLLDTVEALFDDSPLTALEASARN